MGRKQLTNPLNSEAESRLLTSIHLEDIPLRQLVHGSTDMSWQQRRPLCRLAASSCRNRLVNVKFGVNHALTATWWNGV